ncbi:MAG: methyltransferase, partial [Bacteroidetes bacterium]|nr:methyltransferase [Bacteroidota bacterium]
MASLFYFKQFCIDQTDCAMKVNTDGVLLAAILDGYAPAKILDIGTGTGLIALMLAQRFPSALIDAVEIDENTARTAKNNFSESPFLNRIRLFHSSIERYL